jgi:penicillin-binding protein 1B
MQTIPQEPKEGLKQPQTVPQSPPFFDRPRVRRAIAALLGSLVLAALLFLIAYIRLGHKIDERLAHGPFAGTMDIFSGPRVVAVGDAFTVEQLVSQLLRSGYTTAQNNPAGWFTVNGNGIAITPGSEAHAGGQPCRLEIAGGKIVRITSIPGHVALQETELEPQLLTNLSGNREQRRLVKFADIPPRLIHAVTSVEDKRFFNHSGLDLLRIAKAAWVDMKSGRKEQGASTLSMQLARNFWLEPDKSWKRKFEELILTLHMEHRLTKQQIFEYYANQVYLGSRDTFSIAGFAEGAQAYFSKDLSQLNDSEAALLAGLVQRPGYYNPFRYPDRARQRRDVVLSLMHRNGYLGAEAYAVATANPVQLHRQESAVDQSHYFLDLVRDEVESRIDGAENEGRKIYTSLDPDLQDAAEAAVRLGMEKVDRLLRARKIHGEPAGQPQVALVALDPRTGEVKALIGGRDYHASQLNHATAMRQPGSVFKPIVYAAALGTAVEGGREVFTPASVVSDTPAHFRYDGQDYQPRNFHGESTGDVTLRYALAHSLNIATVSLAERVGLNTVVRTAQRLGLNDGIKPTPAVALGAYEVTPLEIAGAYTAFANQGTYVPAAMLAEGRAADGRVLYHHLPESHAALDPRVAFLMDSLMQEVLRSGTGAGVRSLGFTQPAAGKTGTSRDGWFVGFTSQLLCVVWVGFDDNSDLNLEGARSALPIWAEFMTRAARLHPYRDAKPFAMPAGIHSEEICAESGQLAGPFCTDVRSDVFIKGSEPAAQCSMHQVAPVISDAGAIDH